MKDATGSVLYIGKAKSLKLRVQSYFRESSKERYQIEFLMQRTKDIEYLLTDTEKEALLLENTLIKKYQPRYNLFLRDDKSYASLKLTSAHPFPALYVTRHILKDDSLYFGPYVSALSLRKTKDFLISSFQLRTCSDREFANRSRPCLEYDIGRCSAPCVGKISRQEYSKQVEEVQLFLRGRHKELLKRLSLRMEQASKGLAYEEAARIRDLIHFIRETLQKQKMVHHNGDDYDCVGFCQTDSKTVFCVLMIRNGKLLEQKTFLFQRVAEETKEMMSHFLLQYYSFVPEIPPEIYLAEELKDQKEIIKILSDQKKAKVVIKVARRGEKKKMVDLAIQNAVSHLQQKTSFEKISQQLQFHLSLEMEPWTIECVDISNLQGGQAVGALVCFQGGSPLKKHYRKFRIHFDEGPNDYAMMREVLTRRFKRTLNVQTVDEREKWKLPDLLLVDGGKGQLEIARRVLSDLGLHQLPVIAIAKAKNEESQDKIFVVGRKNPIPFSKSSKTLLYLMRIRDEAHRFGITYHRKLRSKELGLFKNAQMRGGRE